MRAELEVLLETLRALKNEGTKDVFIEDATLSALREQVAICAREQGDSQAGATAVREPAPREIPVPSPKEVSPPRSFSEEIPSPSAPEKSAEKSPPAFDFSISQARAASVPAEGTKADRLAALRTQMQEDPVCLEHLRPGKRLVFGEGDPDCDIFFCGEAPGAEEETEGLPFVGPAGQLLTKMIAAMGLARERVYIGNIMKWRPELPTTYGNRPPTADEMAYCLPYLIAQLEIVRPRVIVALGLTAVNGLLGYDPNRRIGEMRGRKLSFRDVPLVATYHPSYLLRNGSMKSKRAAWEDFLAVMEIAEIATTERQRGFFL